MKMKHLLGGTLALLMAAAFCSFAPSLRAQNRYNAQQQGQQQQQQPPTQQSSKTFTGKIMKLQNGKYALVTGKTATGGLAGHYLDDEKDAQKYEGKTVMVTGTLDPSTNMIHVSKIQAE